MVVPETNAVEIRNLIKVLTRNGILQGRNPSLLFISIFSYTDSKHMTDEHTM